MNGRDLFEIWAPPWQERWTKFAKPALFTNIQGYLIGDGTFRMPPLPLEIAQLNNQTTAIIVDLPGASGVESGIALAEQGFRPVPLYNGVHEEKIGSLLQAIDNTPIVDALKEGAGYMRKSTIRHDAPPAFLLDYNRDMVLLENSEVYDNRWSLDFEDMPNAEYMKQASINSVMVWTNGETRNDLLPIIESYKDSGIEIETYTERQPFQPNAQGIATNSLNTSSIIIPPMREDVRKFENARFGLLLIIGVALINLFFMFFGHEEPIFWTAPSIMWLTYLWVPEIVGDVFAVILTGAYVALYFLSQKRRVLMPAALSFFGFDTAVFYIYVVYYSVTNNLMEWIEGFGLFLLAAPICFLVLLIRGVMAYEKLHSLDNYEYLCSLDELDDYHYGVAHSHRRHFRGYRGYGGYGGSGLGGYGGHGYRGHRGYGSGFGG